MSTDVATYQARRMYCRNALMGRGRGPRGRNFRCRPGRGRRSFCTASSRRCFSRSSCTSSRGSPPASSASRCFDDPKSPTGQPRRTESVFVPNDGGSRARRRRARPERSPGRGHRQGCQARWATRRAPTTDGSVLRLRHDLQSRGRTEVCLERAQVVHLAAGRTGPPVDSRPLGERRQ
jgi:hypothetical protein